MPEGPPPRFSGWEVELGPGHWEALSGRVLSSDVNVSYSDLVDVASRRLELYQLQVAPYGELGRRFAVAKPKEVQRVRSRRCYWMVGSSTQGWITCPNDLQERLERRDTAAVEDSALGRCASVKGWWEEGSSGKLSFKQHFVEGILDGWADEGGGPYRLTLGLLGKIDAEDFTGFRSQRPREMKAAKGKVEKKLPESKKPPWIPSHCSIAVKGWSSVDGFCLKSDTFELWGDWQTDGGLLGTIGRDGSQGTFHLKVFAAPMEQAVEPRWLASQWARLHPTWHSMTVLRLRGSPLLEDGNIIHEVNWTADDQSFPEELRLRVCFGPDLDADAFWRLAPGEVQRLGGAEDSPPGFVVATYHSRQTLELDPPKTLAPAIQVEDNEDPNEGPKEDGDGDMQREPKRAREPLLLPLRFAPSKAFPHALVGPWLRGGALIEVGHHFSCREADDTFQMQIFPEIVYPHWGGWILDVARSSSLVLEWVTKVNVENRGKTRTIRWIRPWVFKGMIEVLSAGTSEVDGVYLPDFTGNIMKYTKEGGDIELRHVKGIWELAPAETEDKVYYAYETLNPAEGQWDANSAVMGNVPAPCVRLWLAEEKLVQEALRQSHETSPHMVPLDSLRWNVLPRYVNVLKISERETSLCLSEGLLQHFSGDATVIFDFSDFSSSLASFWAPEGLESESLAGFTLTTYDAGQMPSIWCTVARPEGGLLPNQLGSSPESFTFQGQEVLRRAVLRLREKGALIFALQLLLPDMTGSHADVTKKSDTFLAALTHALLESDYGASGPPKEVHLVVDAPEEIITCRKCVERVIAKRSDASFLNAMKVESNHRPKWLTETLLQDLQPRRPRSKLPSVNAKKLKEDPAVRGILVVQFSKLAEVVRDVLNQEEIADEGPYAVSPGSALKWLEVNMYHICQHFILPLTMDNACSYVELVANDLQVPEWMVSHAWSTNFAATSGMLMQHALSRRSSAVDEKETEQSMCYWCCTLANNQHDLSALQDPDLLKTPFARVLLSPTCCGTVLLCDPAVTPLKRVWCVFEAHLTQKLRFTDLSSKGCHFLDLVAFDQKKSLTFEAHALAILQDGAKGWNEIAQGGAHFPLEVAHAGTTVDVRFAEASLQSDRRAIMNHIAYGKASAQAPPVKHPSYDQLNDFVHSAFASAELYRLACDRPEGCVERAKELLLLGADPNSFIREGNTALLALVGADPTQPAPAELEIFQEMSSLLIENGARINHVNSHMQTALDHLQEKMENSELVEYMKKQGARSFEESAIEAEEHWNECIKEVLWKGGFGAPSEKVGKTTQAFGGSGGGGTGAKLLGKAEQSLREAASYLKVYPKAPCFIDTPSGAHDKHNLRGKSVLAALKASGAPNPLELRCSGTWHPRGSLPLLQLKISLATKT